MGKSKRSKTVRVTAAFLVPVNIEIDAYLDEEGTAQVEDVRLAHLQGLTVRQVEESLDDDAIDYLNQIVAEAVAKAGR